jgi:hypothetical protein
MKISYIGFLFMSIFTLSFAQVNWMTMDQAITAQKENPKKL